MGWMHSCYVPGDFRIWWHRAKAGAKWECPECSRIWELHRRNPTGYYAFWEWR